MSHNHDYQTITIIVNGEPISKQVHKSNLRTPQDRRNLEKSLQNFYEALAKAEGKNT